MTEPPGVVTESRPLSYYGQRRHVDSSSLLRPDDSLTPYEDLAAMAMLSAQPAAPCNVTKLLLPNESTAQQLYPTLFPHAISADNTMYHLTTAANDSQVCSMLLLIVTSQACSQTLLQWVSLTL